MKMNLYACVRNKRFANENKRFNQPLTKKQDLNVLNSIRNDKESFIETKLNYLLNTKYKGNSKVREDILGELSLYSLNMKIAIDCNDKKAIKNLKKEFIQYLNNY